MDDEYTPVMPITTDWKVVESDGKIYVESDTVAHEQFHFDDAWLQVTGNMTTETKRIMAEFIADQLNYAGTHNTHDID
jgi:hypothetical protein